ncbi:hypothetical protein [Paenibacillus periandrae]|uniref:hypothetical protein n=1 Tax=Paenibacillus periandrae TaxID=1761741 RepID=UPI003B832099
MKSLKAAAGRSVGIKQGSQLAKMELRLLLTPYELLQKKFEELDTNSVRPAIVSD